MRNIPDAGRIGPDFLDIDGQTVRLFRRLGVPFEVSTIFRYGGGGEINEAVEQATLRPVQAGFLSKPTIPFTPHMRGGVQNARGMHQSDIAVLGRPGISMDQCAVNLRGDRQTCRTRAW